jgi:hypothetical protein
MKNRKRGGFGAFALAIACGGGGSDDDADTGSSSGTPMTGPSTDPDDDGSSGAGPSSTSADSSEGESSAGHDASSTDESTDTGVVPCVLGDAWEIVDEWTPSPPEGAASRGIGFGADGAIYVAGSVEPTPETPRWIVRKSIDDGASWDIVDDFELVPGLGSGGGDVAVADDGRVYVLGGATAVGTETHRIVRRSADGGASWETIDDFVYAPGYASYSSSLAIAPDGSIWTTGQGGSATSSHWIVRTSADGGDSWETVDDFQLVLGQVSLPSSVAFTPDGEPFVSGRGFAAPEESHWIVRSTAAAGTWTTVDDFMPDEGAGAAQAFTSDRMWIAGAMFVDGVQHWVIRRAETIDAWTTIDDYTEPGAGLGAVGVLDLGDGLVLATGTRTAVGDPPRAITRRSFDDGDTWETIDEYEFGAAIYAGGMRVAPDGDVWQSSLAVDDENRKHWHVRRIACE